MKIIILDIDGVLNVIPQGHDEYGGIFHPHFMDNLKRIIDETGAKIVISSSWRKSGLQKMQELWKHRNIAGEVIDVTPSLYLQKGGSLVFWNKKQDRHPREKINGYSIPRGCEIEYWLNLEKNNYEIESYVILDDDTDMLLSQKDNFVQCSMNDDHEDCIDLGYGLTNKCAEKAIRILNKKEEDVSKDNVFDFCSVRLKNCLISAGFTKDVTFEKLLSTTTFELVKFRNFGKRSLVEIKELMKERGIDYK